MADANNTIFPSTRWSIISTLSRPGEKSREDAVSYFLAAYRPPLEAFMDWRFSDLPAVDREDLLQGFIADRLLAQKLYAKAMEGSVRFRPYIRTALVFYVFDELRHQKRYQQAIDEATLEKLVRETPTDTSAPDPFDVEWARLVIVEAIMRLRKDCLESERTLMWDVFDLRMRRKIYYGQPPVEYAVLAQKLGRTEHELRNLLVSVKRMLKRHLLDIVRGYVVDDKSAEEELEDLQRIVSGGMALETAV